MKCPYRTHRKEYPDPKDNRAFHTEETFEPCYGCECAYWVHTNSAFEEEGYCGKAKADMSEDKKDD